METSDCRRRTLARSQAGSVEKCSCGSVHLAIGPLTLRLDPDTFVVVARMIARALEGMVVPDTAATCWRRAPHDPS